MSELGVYVLGILCQQASVPAFRLNSSRALITLLLLFTFLIYQYYCTFIVASLITDPPKTIKSVTDLIDSGLEIGSADEIYTKSLFYVCIIKMFLYL